MQGIDKRSTVRREKSECTGCGACAAICPKGAIEMQRDEEGFLYPRVDPMLCIGCDLCEKRCPAGKETEEREVMAFGAQNHDAQIRKESSSGGIFTILVKKALEKGSVVFGAVMDENMRTEHIGVFAYESALQMRGSKYVQSDCTDALQHALRLLEKGIPVLFSGTPCQIAGLKALTGNRYDDLLLTIDFVCHGVPSPGVFESYLKELEKKRGSAVVGYDFRDKRLGWKNFSATAHYKDGSQSSGTQTIEPFLYGFLQNLYLRPSCMQCTNLRDRHHVSDITLADLWGIGELDPEKDDDSGLSLVMANTERGKQMIEACAEEMEIFCVDYRKLRRANPSIWNPASAHEKRKRFFEAYKKRGFESTYVMKLLAGPSKAERLIKRIAHLPIGLVRRIRVRMDKAFIHVEEDK